MLLFTMICPSVQDLSATLHVASLTNVLFLGTFQGFALKVWGGVLGV